MYALIYTDIIGTHFLGVPYSSHGAAKAAKMQYEARGIRNIRIAILNEDIPQ